MFRTFKKFFDKNEPKSNSDSGAAECTVGEPQENEMEIPENEVVEPHENEMEIPEKEVIDHVKVDPEDLQDIYSCQDQLLESHKELSDFLYRSFLRGRSIAKEIDRHDASTQDAVEEVAKKYGVPDDGFNLQLPPQRDMPAVFKRVDNAENEEEVKDADQSVADKGS